jgi:hypothetical protein
MFGHLATLDAEREPAGSTVSYCELLPIIFCQGLTKKLAAEETKRTKRRKQSNPCWKNLQQKFVCDERKNYTKEKMDSINQCDS